MDRKCLVCKFRIECLKRAKYFKDHKQELKDKRKIWYKENRDELLKQAREYYQDHKEEIKKKYKRRKKNA